MAVDDSPGLGWVEGGQVGYVLSACTALCTIKSSFRVLKALQMVIPGRTRRKDGRVLTQRCRTGGRLTVSSTGDSNRKAVFCLVNGDSPITS